MSETTSYYKKVASVTVTNGGSDYTSAPTVTIGGNATATATISGGKVTAITVTAAGYNYLTPPTITFTGGGGSGAAATANMVYIDDGYNGFKQSLSHLIANQLPDFVRTEYPVFITFLEKYYEFLDEENQVNNFLLNYEKNFDINRTLDTFLPKFKNQYAQNFPLTAQIDDRRLIKFIKQFYEAKGSEKAIELLFRILYNARTEIFYPSEQVLRASDGIWIEDITLKLAVDSDITANPFDLNSRTAKITYYENISSVTYERTVETSISNVTKFAYVSPAVYELVTTLPKTATIRVPGAGASANALVSGGEVKAIVGETNKTFSSITTAGTLVATVATSGTAGQFTCGASTLAVNDRITITGTRAGSGTITGYTTGTVYRVSAVTGASPNVTGFTLTTEAGVAIVTTAGTLTGLTYTTSTPSSSGYFLNKYNETDTTLNPYTLVGRDNKAAIRIDAVNTKNGCPTAVSIFDTGFDFERETFTAIIESSLGCTATLSFTTGAVNVKTGRFRDSRGMLSNVNRLQDNFYYQNYSYVIRSNVPSNKWLDIVKNTTHPAGTAIFGELTIEQTVDFNQFITTPIQPLHIYEFVLEELTASGGITRNNEFYFAVNFIKVLTDSATVAEANSSHVFKVLSDAATVADITTLDFTVGIYGTEDDTTETLDVFDRVVQYVREVNETTITAENAITDFDKVLQETIFLQDPYAEDFFDENYVSADTTEFDFAKVIADAATASESQAIGIDKSLTDTAINSDTFTRTVEYYRTFAESVISNEYANAGIEKPETDVATAAETSTNHLYKYLTDSVASTDTIGIIPYLVKTDNAGATELLIVANDAATIDSIAATEQSLINILKGLFETVTVTESGIINIQDYVEGEFGSDFVGQATYFN